MIEVCALKEDNLDAFNRLFTDYYKELDCDEDAEHLLKEYVVPDYISGMYKIDVLLSDGKACGFVVYQIDDIDNEWNLKEGCGDIREIYVAPAERKQGFGKFLLYTAEMKMKESGAKISYLLPYDKAEPFFTACGYKKTEVYYPDFDCFLFEKTNLNNCNCK